MTLQTSGAISLQDIAAEFLTDPNIGDCAFAAGLGEVNIALSDFYGLTNTVLVPPEYLGLLQNTVSGELGDGSFPVKFSKDGKYLVSAITNLPDGGFEIYGHDNGVFTFIDRFEGTEGGRLGFRVRTCLDISDDGGLILAGEPNGGSQGQAKLFSFDGNSLTFITNIDWAEVGDTKFGSSVALGADGLIMIASRERLHAGSWDIDFGLVEIDSIALPTTGGFSGLIMALYDQDDFGQVYVSNNFDSTDVTSGGRVWRYLFDFNGLTLSLDQTITAPVPTANESFGNNFSLSNNGLWLLVEGLNSGNRRYYLYKNVAGSMQFVNEVNYGSLINVPPAYPDRVVISPDGKYLISKEYLETAGDIRYFMFENRNGVFVRKVADKIEDVDLSNATLHGIPISTDNKILLLPNSNLINPATSENIGGGYIVKTNLNPIITKVASENSYDANPQVEDSNYGLSGTTISSTGEFFAVNSPDSNVVGTNTFAFSEFFKQTNGFATSIGKFTPSTYTLSTMTAGCPVMDDLGEYWLVARQTSPSSLTLFKREIDPELPETVSEVDLDYVYTGADTNFGNVQPFMSRDGTLILTADTTNDGTGYLITNTNGTLTDTDSFQPNDIAAGDAFGAGGLEASESGQWIVGCSHGDDSNTGALYLFENVAGTVTQVDKAVPSLAETGDRIGKFGAAISADGVWIVVGSEQKNGVRGLGWLFKREGSTLVEQGLIQRVLEDGITQGYFGGRPVISDTGARIYVTQYNFSDVLDDGGMILVFENANGFVTFDSALQPSTVSSGSRFGRNRFGVSSGGDYLTATQLSDNVVDDAGLVWLLGLTEEEITT